MKILSAILMMAFLFVTVGGNSADYTATAYALRGKTASGHPVARGVVAADPKILKLGTKIRIEAGAYTGNYTVRDTGGKIKGRKIDIWMPTSKEARKFGRRKVRVIVIGS